MRIFRQEKNNPESSENKKFFKELRFLAVLDDFFNWMKKIQFQRKSELKQMIRDFLRSKGKSSLVETGVMAAPVQELAKKRQEETNTFSGKVGDLFEGFILKFNKAAELASKAVKEHVGKLDTTPANKEYIHRLASEVLLPESQDGVSPTLRAMGKLVDSSQSNSTQLVPLDSMLKEVHSDAHEFVSGRYQDVVSAQKASSVDAFWESFASLAFLHSALVRMNGMLDSRDFDFNYVAKEMNTISTLKEVRALGVIVKDTPSLVIISNFLETGREYKSATPFDGMTDGPSPFSKHF